jgi:hypothetical protein
MPGHPAAHRAIETAAIETPAAAKAQSTIAQIISALDDRNVLRALRLLEPARETSESSSGPDEAAPRCVTCITRGE